MVPNRRADKIMANRFPHLFSPIQINSLRFPNRIMIAPMSFVTEDALSICNDFGQSGASVMTLGSMQIDEEWSQLMGYPNPFAPTKGHVVGGKNLRDQMQALQKCGMYASVQLIHAGRYGHNYADKTREGRAIGPISETYRHKKGHDIEVIGMDRTMIDHVSDNYARAAVNYKNFGFDMIMLHFAHGWLPWEFLSPTFNKRTDEFGGSFENRIKFPTMIIEKVRKAVGPEYPIELRICGKEWIKGGLEIDEVARFVKTVEHLIDIVHVSAGIDSEMEISHHMWSSNFKPHVDKIELAAEMKKRVNIPVCTVGSIILPEEAEEAIASGKCDLIAIGREALVDPDWGVKAYEGRSDDIYPCLRCSACSEKTGLGCASNPRYSHFATIPKVLPKAEQRKHVVVIGGGPGGMRAAITGAQRGHRVTLLEKDDQLGGRIKHFKEDRYKYDLYIFWEFLKKQVAKHDIDVRLNTAATPELVRELNPDVIIVAIGAVPAMPDIPGADQPHVMQAVDVYANPELVRGNVVVIGGGTVGIETGLYIADRGHPCDVVEITGEIAAGETFGVWKYALNWTMEKYPQLHTHTNTACKEIRQNEVVVEDASGRKTIKADTVVMATGFVPRKEEADSFYGICDKTYKIGDCYKVRKLYAATNEGYHRLANL